MLTSALTMAETQISLTPPDLRNPSSSPLSYSQQVSETLGPLGTRFSTGAYLFLHYTLLCSYFSSGGGYIQKFSPVPLLPFSTPILYAIVATLPIFLLPAEIMSTVNNVLVLGALASFLGIVSLGIPSADTSILEIPSRLPDLNCVVTVVPIFLLTLVFHNVIPTVTKNMNYDRKAVFSCITVGSFVPFLLFLVYDYTILGNVSGRGFQTVIDPIAVLQEAGGPNGELLPDLVAGFCFLAITTSLIGFVDGLQTILNPFFEENDKRDLIVPALITVPPVAVACFGEDVFLTALNLGATFGVTLLFLVIPALTALKDRGFSAPAIGMLMTALLALSSTLIEVPQDFIL
jgi:tyrosine-specific transport protein